MSWWGKLIGGTLGLLVGGPLGAMLGAYFGHGFDKRATNVKGPKVLPGDQERVQLAFFAATFSVMGHIAKSDGRVTRDEIDLAMALMDEMQLSPEQRELAQVLFNQGKSPDFDFEGTVTQFREECHRRTTLMRMFLEIQIQAAMADRRMGSQENLLLLRLGAILGFDRGTLEQIIEMVQGATHSRAQVEQFSPEDAYRILGVSPDESTAEIRKAYRRLIGQHHPDKLVAKGLPEEMIRLANEKTGEIRKAWETIRAVRQGT